MTETMEMVRFIFDIIATMMIVVTFWFNVNTFRRQQRASIHCYIKPINGIFSIVIENNGKAVAENVIIKKMKVTYCGRDVSQEVRQNKLNIAAGKNIVFYLSSDGIKDDSIECEYYIEYRSKFKYGKIKYKGTTVLSSGSSVRRSYTINDILLDINDNINHQLKLLNNTLSENRLQKEMTISINGEKTHIDAEMTKMYKNYAPENELERYMKNDSERLQAKIKGHKLGAIDVYIFGYRNLIEKLKELENDIGDNNIEIEVGWFRYKITDVSITYESLLSEEHRVIFRYASSVDKVKESKAEK